MCLKYGLYRGTQGQVGVTDDTGRDLGCIIMSTITLPGNAPYEFRLTYRLHLFGAALPISGMALYEYGLDDIVSSTDILQQLVE
jgi:hypothetical protein